MQNLSFSTKIPMYGCTFYFKLVDDVEKEVNKLRKKFKLPLTKGPFEGYADEYEFQYYYIIIGYEYLSMNTFCHEMFHNVNTILDDREIKDEEAKAWLCGHLSQKVYDFLKRNQIELK